MTTKDDNLSGSDTPDDPKKSRKLNTSCSLTEIQLEKLIASTKSGNRNTYELRALGISHPAGRIADLEKRGYVYGSTRITTVDGDGFAHNNVALYELLSYPVEGKTQ